jgi:hypothetical protein
MADAQQEMWDESKVESKQVWEARLNKAKTSRMTFERQWYLNLSFYFGKQWVQWNASEIPASIGRLIEPAQPRNRVRLTINKTRKIMRKEMARVNKEQIRGFVTPNTTDDVDVTASRAADKLVDYLIQETKLPIVMKRADFWMLICGTAFIKDYYDPTKIIGGAMGGPVVETVSPFHIFVPNLDEPDIENQPWVMHVTVRSPEEVEEEYGIKVNDASILATNTIESKLLSVMGMTQGSAKQKGVEVKEVWVKPNARYEQGLHMVWTSSETLDSGPFPYAHGEFPFTRRQYIESGMFYADSLVTDLIQPQMEYNRTRSQIVEDKNKMAKPMLAAVEGSISPSKIRNVAGEIITYRPGTGPPTPIPLTPIPSYVIEHIRTLASEMDEMASQQTNDQSLPPGVTAATAIAYLQEEQNSLVTDTVRDKEQAWMKIICHFLSYIGQYWDAQHTITVVGQNENFEAFKFSQSELRSQTDWRVVVGSGTPKSYPAQQAQIMELMKMGVVPAAEALRYMELGDTARLYEMMQIDTREADKENNRMKDGIDCQVTDHQEHTEHIQAHDNFRKREEYDSVDENVKQLFMRHVWLHIIYYMMETMPGVPLPFDPKIIQGVVASQVPVDVGMMLQARGLFHAATMQGAPAGAPPAQGTTPQIPPQQTQPGMM